MVGDRAVSRIPGINYFAALVVDAEKIELADSQLMRRGRRLKMP